jgi:hypothetical protein
LDLQVEKAQAARDSLLGSIERRVQDGLDELEAATRHGVGMLRRDTSPRQVFDSAIYSDATQGPGGRDFDREFDRACSALASEFAGYCDRLNGVGNQVTDVIRKNASELQQRYAYEQDEFFNMACFYREKLKEESAYLTSALTKHATTLSEDVDRDLSSKWMDITSDLDMCKRTVKLSLKTMDAKLASTCRRLDVKPPPPVRRTSVPSVKLDACDEEPKESKSVPILDSVANLRRGRYADSTGPKSPDVPTRPAPTAPAEKTEPQEEQSQSAQGQFTLPLVDSAQGEPAENKVFGPAAPRARIPRRDRDTV